MTYSSRKDLISAGFGRGGLDATASACWSSVMISLQMSMHSLQMYTVGPAINFLTSFCDLPQKEQRNVSSVRRTIKVSRADYYSSCVKPEGFRASVAGATRRKSSRRLRGGCQRPARLTVR